MQRPPLFPYLHVAVDMLDSLCTMYRLLLFLLPVPFFAVCVVMIAANGILGNVDPENVDRQTFVRVMQLRDFSRFSPDLVKRLTYRAEQEFGRHSQKKPKFELPSWEQKIHTYFQTHRSSRQSRIETNLTLMAKTRYFQYMYEYQSGTLVQKAALMNDVVEDVNYWRTVYFDYLRSLHLPEPTFMELYQDFERMIEDFKTGASPEDVILIDLFAKDMSRALFATGVQKSIMNFLSLPGQRQ